MTWSDEMLKKTYECDMGVKFKVIDIKDWAKAVLDKDKENREIVTYRYSDELDLISEFPEIRNKMKKALERLGSSAWREQVKTAKKVIE